MFAANVVQRVTKTVLDVVFPPVCLGCGVEGEYICAACSFDMPRLEGPLCPSCGTPMPLNVLCGRCKVRLPSAEGIRSVFAMEGAVRDAVHGLKYGQLRVLAGPLGREMAAELEAMPFAPDVVAPVPLHRRRLRERGYNQSALLAQRIGVEAGIRFEADLLARHRDTPQQTQMTNREQRLANVALAFSSGTDASGLRVLVVDDVFTTGATLQSCARVLRANGAAEVWGLTLAREL